MVGEHFEKGRESQLEWFDPSPKGLCLEDVLQAREFPVRRFAN
jgi:hypothetical protein